MSNVTSHLPNLDAIETEDAAIDAQVDALRASVEEQVKALHAKREENRKAVLSTVVQAIEADGLNLLTDPASAKNVYGLGWFGSRGTREFTDAFHAAIGLPTESPTGWWMFGEPTDSDYTAKHPVLQMFAPFNPQTSVEHIKDVAVNVEAVFEAQEDILAEFNRAPSIVCGWKDGRYLRIWGDGETGGFTLGFEGASWTEQTFGTLAEALIAASRTEGLVNSFTD
ncbi:hypothetical protein [Aeromicrobium sp. 179-A 4D2 NHS]|uniref:hypothetical protein n=1 Tax=Aeromicrobium sp. 179-A 4D2 NHS TaxID=3142375 RepID=UPI0039A27C10